MVRSSWALSTRVLLALALLSIRTVLGLSLAWPNDPEEGTSFSITWSGGTAPYVVQVLKSDLSQTLYQYTGSANVTYWNFDVAAGTQVIVKINDSADTTVSSPAITVLAALAIKPPATVTQGSAATFTWSGGWPPYTAYILTPDLTEYHFKYTGTDTTGTWTVDLSPGVPPSIIFEVMDNQNIKVTSKAISVAGVPASSVTNTPTGTSTSNSPSQTSTTNSAVSPTAVSNTLTSTGTSTSPSSSTPIPTSSPSAVSNTNTVTNTGTAPSTTPSTTPTGSVTTSSSYSSATAPPPPVSNASKSNAGAIAGGVVGGLAALALIAAAAFFFTRRRRQQHTAVSTTEETASSGATFTSNSTPGGFVPYNGWRGNGGGAGGAGIVGNGAGGGVNDAQSPVANSFTQSPFSAPQMTQTGQNQNQYAQPSQPPQSQSQSQLSATQTDPTTQPSTHHNYPRSPMTPFTFQTYGDTSTLPSYVTPPSAGDGSSRMGMSDAGSIRRLVSPAPPLYFSGRAEL